MERFRPRGGSGLLAFTIGRSPVTDRGTISEAGLDAPVWESNLPTTLAKSSA